MVGKIVIDGKISSGPRFDREVVFQDFRLFPWRTVMGNIEFGLELQDVPKRLKHYKAYF